MKKLLYILLTPIFFLLVSCGGGSDNLQPIDPPTQSLEEILVGKKWCLSNNTQDGFLLSPGGGFFTTQQCTPHDWQGSWIVEDSLIKYYITTNSIQTTMLWGEVSEYSSTQIKILLNNNSSTTLEAVYSLTPEDIYGCTDPNATNYNTSATCNDGSCIGGLAIGDVYQGGFIFYLDGNGGGLIAAPFDQATGNGTIGNPMGGAPWACYGPPCVTAANLCENLTLGGYSDWYLPSKDELNQLYLNKGFNYMPGRYWSSTEDSSDNERAWTHNFSSNSQNTWNKVQSFLNVRAIRAF